jgi:acetyl esterase
MTKQPLLTASPDIFDPAIQLLVHQLAAHAAPPIHTLAPEEARKGLLRIQTGFQTNNLVQLRKVKMYGRVVPVHVIRPLSAPQPAAAVLYFHGGGWVVGDYTTHGRLANQLAAASNSVVIFVDYDRAPEHQYPVAIEQAYAATCYVAEHTDEFSIDAAHLAVAGDSSGANMATVTAILARQRSGPAIAGQVLLYPATDAAFETASYQQFSQGPWLTKAAMQWFWDQYLPSPAERKAHTASPLQASVEQLTGLPPALILTAEHDVLRDEGEAYARKLMQAGVEVVSTRYNGAIHDFMMFDAVAAAAPARAALAQAADFLKNALRGQ